MYKRSLNSGVAPALIAHLSGLLPTQQETMGQITVEILRAGQTLNRKNLCSRLIGRLDRAASPDEEAHFQTLITLLFAKD